MIGRSSGCRRSVRVMMRNDYRRYEDRATADRGQDDPLPKFPGWPSTESMPPAGSGGVFLTVGAGYQVFGGDYQAGRLGTAHLAGMATAAHSMKLYDTLAEAKSATSARNARSPHRTRGFWTPALAEGGGFTVRWVALRRPRRRGSPEPLSPPRAGPAP